MKIIEKINNLRSNRNDKKRIKEGLEILDEFFAELNGK